MIYFTALIFKCVCHCIRTMFRVLGVYNFGWMKNNRNSHSELLQLIVHGFSGFTVCHVKWWKAWQCVIFDQKERKGPSIFDVGNIFPWFLTSPSPMLADSFWKLSAFKFWLIWTPLHYRHLLWTAPGLVSERKRRLPKADSLSTFFSIF